MAISDQIVQDVMANVHDFYFENEEQEKTGQTLFKEFAEKHAHKFSDNFV
tara:strand:+ start:70 stop:219 length:150 start_codon:yes stop_codon:yes gene_type:complete